MIKRLGAWSVLRFLAGACGATGGVRARDVFSDAV